MQYQQTPQGLDALYNLPVGMAPQAMQLLGQQQNADQMTQQDQARELAYNTANDPLKLQEKDLANQTTLAGLPGVGARAQMDVRKNYNQDVLNPGTLAVGAAKNSEAVTQAHADEAEAMGNRMAQMAEEAFANPVGAADRIKQELAASGHAGLWNPDWERSDPGTLYKQLRDTGADIQQASSKYRQAMATQAAKNEGIQIAANSRQQVALLQTQQRHNDAMALMSNKLSIAKTKQSYQNYAVQMQRIADEETDPELKKTYQKEADSAKTAALQFPSAAATVTTGVQPSMDALGITSNGAMRGAQGAPQSAPQVGVVVKGYRFKGGDPSDKNNWEPQ